MSRAEMEIKPRSAPGWARCITVPIIMSTIQTFSRIAAAAIGVSCLLALTTDAGARAQQPAPRGGPAYKVDPFWPKPLPNKWSMQQIVDMYVDRDDHIWVINRRTDARPDELNAMTTPPRGDCCVLGPEILEFDQEGNVVNSWGGPGYHPGWPGRLQTIAVDRDKNVYLSGTTPGDSIIKFSRDGKFLWDFGHRGPKIPADQVKQDNQQTAVFPPGIGSFELDEDAREIFISDGFLNKRVLVYDMDSGAFKRGWGGKGIPLSEIDNNPTPPYDISGPPPDQTQFAPALHCIHFSRDGLVYVCERGSDRIQVFTKQGKFVKQFLGSSLHAGAWRELRRHLEHHRPAMRHRLSPRALNRSAAAVRLRRRRHRQHGLDPQPADRRAGGIVRRQWTLRRHAPLDRRDRRRLQGQRVHR